ncbi:uncharacterized protein BDZ99DRAFT_381703, partial [Mytilinidion resinicola]
MENDEVFRRLAETRSYFRGSAKLPLRCLQFETQEMEGARTLDAKNISRLLRIYETEGCHRLEPEHRIAALINKDILAHTLRRGDGTREFQTTELMDQREDPLLLEFENGVHITCLHGQHRIEAAKQYLDNIEKWWVIDLYLDDLPNTIALHLRTEYSNARAFCDGDIFRYLRKYSKNENRAQESKWQARLKDSESKEKDIKKLVSKMRPLCDAFDDLLPFIGLWATLRLGTFHRYLTLRCEQELIHYLSYIRTTWSFILLDDARLFALLDPRTVSFLELLSPLYSSADWAEIEESMGSRYLFPAIVDQEVRNDILPRLKSQSRIPSLHTFSEDTKYLEPCAKVMKGLLRPKFKGSIFHAFRKGFNPSPQSSVQCAEKVFKNTLTNLRPRVQFQLKYLEAWLFSMRHFPKLIEYNPRKDHGKIKPKTKLCDILWGDLGLLVETGGFNLPEASRLANANHLENMVKDFVVGVCLGDIYDVQEADVRAVVRSIYDSIVSIGSTPRITTSPPLTINDIQQSKLQRCGRPYEKSHLLDREFLFITNMGDLRPERVREYITSFGIKREIFRAFFDIP